MEKEDFWHNQKQIFFAQKVLFSLEEIAISPLVMQESISLALTGALEMPILVCKSVWSKLF